MMQAARTASRDEVPVLDLENLLSEKGIQRLARELRNACETTGFFYVANHGVPEKVIEDAFQATKRYFALPVEQRLRDKIDERFRRGFMPMGINQHPGFAPDLKESFDYGFDLPLDDPDVAAGRPLHGPNRWPDLPWFRTAAEAYFESTMTLGRNLLRFVALSLGQPEGFFLPWCQKPMVLTRLFHYPPQPKNGDEKQLGVAPHTDYGMVTILAQDPVGGLEVLKRDGEWIAAPYIDGTFVINLGDLMKVWTNDVYVSNPHRVINRSGRERYSIPTFFNLDYDAPVACLDTCRSPETPAKYAPIKSGDYLVSRFRTVQKYQPPATA
ncbi:MAG TPA: 2-oxoglutarate and iron-dependent oxygenase domain-containing protein [Candidatus Acidoferrales bacterium]|jgi:isopenicillin N synthase-like dioxygenase|nr:2-oxoglutarate and iron-dependent oxygenase domain-containing protein [Candidatus Acidoferrales bacterium]